MENENIIKLPEFKEKIKKSKDIRLPVKNEILFILKILSMDVKPKNVKISGKKNKRYLVPIHLVNKEIISQEAIDLIIKGNAKEAVNYSNIANFTNGKNCFWQLAPSHYNILRLWLLEKQMTLGSTMSFNRVGSGVNSKLIFRDEKETKDFIEKMDKKKATKTTKTTK